MIRTLVITLALTALFSSPTLAVAGGAVVAGGKTASAILIYESKLDALSQQLILNEIGKQLALGKISAYGSVVDENREPARCVQFQLLQTYNESASLLVEVAKRAGVPEAIRTVGRCAMDTVN